MFIVEHINFIDDFWTGAHMVLSWTDYILQSSGLKLNNITLENVIENYEYHLRYIKNVIQQILKVKQHPISNIINTIIW